ncbi:hypothetical protein ABIF65_006037 [Bradyrhizobium japonicum]|jgi:hypothetical protein|nr:MULTISPECIES: hypothetical protein [Bradyrhizobium]MBR0876607.1 hypothetical protein [Bradyrhizobium liaoningense]MBR0940640.1 hypothetical protein [Bradyrhizobium liaoningense]MBR0996668.1 hypothetical protein [Bradyrhizobium liaoningense]MBR1029990.1 hypothetical protein [Bradyrhizobium liaoningense]MBR1062803.1 hypothetical protein [Bradyrhizobium liaoningense]
MHWTHSPSLRGAELLFVSGVMSMMNVEEEVMGFGRGALLWLLGVPLPIVLLLALFWHH